MVFARWPSLVKIRAWIHHNHHPASRKFHHSPTKFQSDNPSSFSLNFHPTLFPSFQSSEVVDHHHRSYGLDTEDAAFKTHAFRLKWEMLIDSLSRDRANPNRVWEAYCDVGSIVGFEKIPLRIHQQTLRRAVPPTERLGSIIAKRLQAEHKPSVPHLYEDRLQTIIRNIRESGYQPALDDYHFVLAQFVAVAYPDGCRAVFRELVHRQKLEPTYKTYGLCLQAIAHRLTLPCPYRYRKNLLSYSSRMCFELLDDMWTRGVALTSVNFDLAHRIFKATENWSIYEHLLKRGYGIDLANPDRFALEIQPALQQQGQREQQQGGQILSSGLTESSESSRDHFKPIPFSTAALNTLIDALGMRGEISRMVTAFEVLTNPFPKTSSEEVPWMDEDDDEYDSGVYQHHVNNPSSYAYPFTKPNTTTFEFLIRHMAKAKQTVFARHYTNLAFEMDRSENSRLRNELSSRPTTVMSEIEAPQLAVTRAMLLPLHGLGNRTRHRPLLRWAYWMTCQAIHDKQGHLSFYTGWRDRARPDVDQGSLADHEDMGTQVVALVNNNETSGVSQLLRIDFDTPATEEKAGANSRKPFQIDLHIALLERDIQELGDLCDRTEKALKRSTHRLKEKLGRRVWAVKDIFVTSKGRRVHLEKGEWVRAVGFGTSGVGRRFGDRDKSAQIRKNDLPRWMEDDED